MATPDEKGGLSRFHVRTIGVWFGLLLLAVVVFAAWYSGGSRVRDTGTTGPWIGLPPGGTDIADWSTRQILQQLAAAGRPASALAAGCGHDPAWGGETYIATLGDAHGRDAWRIVLEVRDSDVVARASRTNFLPDRPARQAATADSGIVRSLSREQLAGVRDAWRVHSLWAETIGEPLTGADANPTRLEACVDGRYAIRQQPSGEMGARLHAALVRALSLPAAQTSAP